MARPVSHQLPPQACQMRARHLLAGRPHSSRNTGRSDYAATYACLAVLISPIQHTSAAAGMHLSAYTSLVACTRSSKARWVALNRVVASRTKTKNTMPIGSSTEYTNAALSCQQLHAYAVEHHCST
jgi:hypothetical protein